MWTLLALFICSALTISQRGKSGHSLVTQVNKTYTEVYMIGYGKSWELRNDGEAQSCSTGSLRSPLRYLAERTQHTPKKCRQYSTFYPLGDAHFSDPLLAVLGTSCQRHPDHTRSLTVRAPRINCPKVACNTRRPKQNT